MKNTTISKKFYELISTPSDINEHLISLKNYAEECDIVVEMGVRNIVSTWAFLEGSPKKLISLDLFHPSHFGGNLDEVYNAVKETNINFEFVQSDSLLYDLNYCDLLFIDTWHDYLQLKKELYRFQNKVKKFIILHDTISFGYRNENLSNSQEIETNLPKGLNPAVDEFLLLNKDWILWEKKTNNNGLTVLKKNNSIK